MERFGVTKANAQQFGKFLLVGLSNTGLTLAVILALLWFDTPLLVANGIGYGAGFVNSFIWNRRWTFGSTGAMWRETIVYSAVWLGSYLLQMGALLVCSRWLQLNDTPSTIIAMAFFTGPNFLGNKLLTFRKRAA